MLIGSVGNIAVRLLFAVSVLSLAVHGTAIWKKTSGWRKFSRFSMLGQFVLAALASLALIWLLVDGNFWYSYVVDYTSAGLPLIYRIAAFWGGGCGFFAVLDPGSNAVRNGCRLFEARRQ